MTSEETITISLAEYTAMKAEIEYLGHQLAELKRMIFGSKSERFISAVDPQQCLLFELPLAEEPAAIHEEITYTRTKPEDKKHPLRTEIPAHLPRKEEVIEPENIPAGAKKIGEAITEILEYEPAQVYVRRIIRPKYLIQSTDEQTNIIIAALPNLPIPKGNAGPGFLAQITISKFVDHLPLYRQAQIYKRNGLTMAESTLNGWFSATALAIIPVHGALKKQVLSADYLMADETPIPVLTRDKPGATHKGYYWVYYAPVEKLVLFDYRKSRSREGPDEMLEHFSGYLQSDGYEAYTNLKNQANITLLACMAHARRYFDKARDNDPVRAEHALKLFQKLYAIERLPVTNI